MKYHKQIYEDKQRITSLEKKDSFLFIEVEDTIFYPGGGGQPHDTGVIENNNFQGKVVEVFKKEDKIIHKGNQWNWKKQFSNGEVSEDSPRNQLSKRY